MIDVQNLHKYFGELEVLKGIDAHVDKGECVCVIGPSGGGKSTFLRCINLLEVPTKGDIVIEGISVMQNLRQIDKLRQKVGMVFQQFNLFPHMTVMRNITLAPTKLKKMPQNEANELAMELLNRVGLSDKAMEYPSRLSGGQKAEARLRTIILRGKLHGAFPVRLVLHPGFQLHGQTVRRGRVAGEYVLLKRNFLARRADCLCGQCRAAAAQQHKR